MVPSPIRAEVQRLHPSHPARHWGLHSHIDFFELLVFETGGGYHIVGGRRQPVVSGQIVALRPGDRHDLTEVTASTWMLIFTAESVHPNAHIPLRPWCSAAAGSSTDLPLIRAFGGPGLPINPTVLTEEQLPMWSRLLGEMAAEQIERRPLYGRALQAGLTRLLVEAARLAPEPGTPDGRRGLLVEETLTVIDRLYVSGAGLAEVAQAVRRDPSHLTRVVRQQTGRTVGEWLIQRRMADARRRLLETGQSIAAIATAVGYPDAVHFQRQFRARHGLPPGAWRRAALASGSGNQPLDPPVVSQYQP